MLRRLDEQTWLLSGLLRPDEVRERTGVPVPEGRYETLGGYLAEQLQRLPAVGDTVPVEGGRLTVETIEGRRVARVRALMREGWSSGATAVRLVQDEAEKEPAA